MTRKIMKFLKFSWDKGEYVDKSRILGLAGKFRLNAVLFSNPAALKTQIWRWKKYLYIYPWLLIWMQCCKMEIAHLGQNFLNVAGQFQVKNQYNSGKLTFSGIFRVYNINQDLYFRTRYFFLIFWHSTPHM